MEGSIETMSLSNRSEITERGKELRSEENMVKLQRAQGECLGIRGRRRTREAAKSCGEWQAHIDPQVSEWSNPAEVILCHHTVNT